MWRFGYFLFLFVASVQGQGSPDGGGGAKSDQECVLIMTSMVYTLDDGISSKYIDTSNMSTVRYNESLAYVDGTLITKKVMDMTTMCVVTVKKMSNGQESTVMSIDIPMCEELAKGAASDYYDVFKYTDMPTSCPIEPGEYKINNLVADFSDLPINSANVGDYQAKMEFMKCEDDDCNERTLECTLLVDCVIEMK